MPIYRGPDGKIIEERTRKVSVEELQTRVPAQVAAGSAPLADDDATRRVASAPAPTVQSGVKPSDGDERTRLVGAPFAADTVTGAAAVAAYDAVAGWLIIISGPGRGRALAIGYGANSIGRDPGERICLNFGDETLSRSAHAIVTYEPRGRKFYVQNGSGPNLTYLDEQPVLIPCELPERSRIQIGNTTLMFRSFCGPDFDWQDQ